ncbi:MAG TPA: tetratricopeptide repeat protein [Candidatus Sulfotelmatobacter sp.]|jgi:Tfp pilus assembly protein PilF
MAASGRVAAKRDRYNLGAIFGGKNEIPAKKNIVLCAILAIATLAAYSRSVRNPFADLDDPTYVLHNHQIQQGVTLEMLSWALLSTRASNWHPLTWVSHALDCQLYGLAAPGHHFTSLLLHIVNAILLFLLLQQSTGARMRSFVVAGLFALHPINVESVAWVAERKTVLSMFFFLLALGAYEWYARRPSSARYLPIVAFFIFGLASKPMVITLPFVLLLLDFWPLQRIEGWVPPRETPPVPQRPIRSLILEKLPFLLVIAASSALTMMAQKGSLAFDPRLTLSVRIVNALYAYCMYLVKAFWPLHLAPYYPYAGLRLSVGEVFACGMLLAGISVWAWQQRRYAYVPVGWLWFLGTMVPMIGIVQVGDQAMADRYAYLPLVGIFLLFVWRTADWVDGWTIASRWKTTAAALILAVLAILSWRQVGFWHSSQELWTHTLAVTKDNYLAEDFIGADLLEQSFQPGGERYAGEALIHLENAVRINPNDAIAHLNMGIDLQGHGQFEGAIQEFQRANGPARDQNVKTMSLLNLAACYVQTGNLTAARESFQQVLEKEPHNRIAQAGLDGLVRLQELMDAAAAEPTASAYLQLGQLQQSMALISSARASYQRALLIDPNSYSARSALSNLENKAEH